MSIKALDGKITKRYIREIIYGKRGLRQYWEITTDQETMSEDSTWFVMTKIPKLNYKQVGKIDQIRAWVEYGFKQSKSELGWADFRVTNYAQIEKWWQLVMSAYLMVSLHSDSFNPMVTTVSEKFQQHDWWDERKGWKNILNNLRLIIKPYISFNIISRWLKVFPIPQLSLGFPRLINLMNEFDCLRYFVYFGDNFYYSSA